MANLASGSKVGRHDALKGAARFSRRVAGAAVAATLFASSLPFAANAQQATRPSLADQAITRTIARGAAADARGAAADARGAAADARGARADQDTRCINVLLEAKKSGVVFKVQPTRENPCAAVAANGLRVSSLN